MSAEPWRSEVFMRSSHKAGCDYGVDYGAVVVFFLWVVATIVLLVVLAVRGNSQNMALAKHLSWATRQCSGAAPCIICEEARLYEHSAASAGRRQGDRSAFDC